MSSNPSDHVSFHFVAERRGDVLLLRLGGEFDLSCRDEFETRLEKLELDRLGELVVDLRGLGFIDSTGLRMLLKLRNRSKEDGFAFYVLPGDGQVQRVLQVSGLDRVLPTTDDPSKSPASIDDASA